MSRALLAAATLPSALPRSRPARLEVLFDAEHPSLLVLPVLEAVGR